MASEEPRTTGQADLAERIWRGDPGAEDELARAFGERILVLVVARIREREAARDLAQDALLAVLRSLRNGRLEDGERLSAYVLGTARNIANNYLRHRGQEPPMVPADKDLVAERPPEGPESPGRISLVGRALSRLDVAERTILLLTLVEGLKPGEIASRLGLSSEVVRARKSRAVKKVAEAIRKWSRS